jgi:hypothetical protein
MLIRNKGQKIIHIGRTMILPDETKDIDDAMASSPAVCALLGRGALETVQPTTMPAIEPPSSDEKEPASPPDDDKKKKAEWKSAKGAAE